jgi:DNA-binding NarL/FixJ family response regulator
MKILLCDDHPSVTEGVKLRLEMSLSKGTECLVANSGKEAEEFLKEGNIDIIVLDLRLPDSDGFVLMKIIGKTWPNTKIIVYSANQSDYSAIKAIKYGAKGYITKNDSLEDLIKAIKTVIGGRQYFSKIFGNRLDDYLKRAYKGKVPEDLLTDKEWLVLKELNAGLNNVSIGEKLGMAASTVSVHKSSIMRKFGVTTDIELRNLCLENGVG